MGLDMYMTARKYLRTQYEKTSEGVRALPKAKMDGMFETNAVEAEVSYWRKNHWLHGFIVEEFADGEDDCQQIVLREDDLRKIASRLEKWSEDPTALQPRDGFFFGSQDDGWRDECRFRAADDAAQIRKAIEWMNEADADKEWREVVYQASW